MSGGGAANWRSLGAVLLALGVVTGAAYAQQAGTEAADAARLQEIRRAFWALAKDMSEPEAPPEATIQAAAEDARARLVPALCREFLLDFPDSAHGVRVRWLLGRAWALARGDATRAADALEGAIGAYLNQQGPGETSLVAELTSRDIVTPRAEGDWRSTTQDIDGDGRSEVVMTYTFAGHRAQLGGFCSLFHREQDRWAVDRLFGPSPALASSMADAPMAPQAHQVRDLNDDGRQEVLLQCRSVDQQGGLLLVFGFQAGRARRLLSANCPEGKYEFGRRVSGWRQVIIVRRFGTPEDAPESFRRAERHYFAFDGRRYAFVRTRRDAATYLYEQFWAGREAYDAGSFERAAGLLDRAAADDALKTRPRAGRPGAPSRPDRYASPEDERRSYRATGLYLAGLAWAHVGEVQKARRAMADVVAQYTYVNGVSQHSADLLPGYWAERFNARYKQAADLYDAVAAVAPAYALWLYLADHPPEDPATAILNSGVRTEQALVTDITGDGQGDIIVALPAAKGAGTGIVAFVSTEKGWDGYAIAGTDAVRAEQDRGMPRGAISICDALAGTASSDEAGAKWVVGQVADFDGDGVNDIEIQGKRTMRVTWAERGFTLVGADEAPAVEPEAAPSGDDTAQRDLVSLDQIEDAIYDRKKFEPALMWLDTLDGRLRKWPDSAHARAFLAEVGFHRALCHAHLGRWERAAGSYTAVVERYPDLAWSGPAEARARALSPDLEQVQ